MNSSPEVAGMTIALAQMDAPLRGNPLLANLSADARVSDPRLAAVVEQAAQEAAAAAREKGYEEGWAAGLAEVKAAGEHRLAREIARLEEEAAQARARLDEAVLALQTIADDLSSACVPVYDETAAALGPATFALVEAMLGREPSTPETVLVDAVRRALTALPSASEVTVRANPGDLEAVKEAGIDLTTCLGRSVTLISDPSLPSGSALADSEARHVDASLAGAVDRLREVLNP